MKIIDCKGRDLIITIVSISVLHAWKILQEKKSDFTKLRESVQVTWIDRNIEGNEAFSYLLRYRMDSISGLESLWIQAITQPPANYSQFQIKLTP